MPDGHYPQDVSVTFRLPHQLAEAMTTTASFYGRTISDEMRLAARAHLHHHALYLLRENDEVRRDEGDQLEQTTTDTEDRIAALYAQAFTRPTPAPILAELN